MALRDKRTANDVNVSPSVRMTSLLVIPIDPDDCCFMAENPVVDVERTVVVPDASC